MNVELIEFLDTVLELEELVDVYLLEELIKNVLTMTKIDEVKGKLEGSTILKSRQNRLKVLLDDIAQNPRRVQTIWK